MKKRYTIELEPRLILPLSKKRNMDFSSLISELLVKANTEEFGRVPLPDSFVKTKQIHAKSNLATAVNRRSTFRMAFFVGHNFNTALKAAIDLNCIPEELLYITLGSILETRLKLHSALSTTPHAVMHYTFLSRLRPTQMRVCPRLLFSFKDLLDTGVQRHLIQHLAKFPEDQELLPSPTTLELEWTKGRDLTRPIMRV